MTTRVCKDCQRELELEEDFYKRNDKGRRAVLRDGSVPYDRCCKKCSNKKKWEAIKRDTERQVIEAERRRKGLKKYKSTEYGREMSRQRQSLRRAMQQGAAGTYTALDIIDILTRQRGMCAYCGRDLEETGYQIDHILPLSKGGSNYPANLSLACPRCNQSKHDKTLEEWRVDRHAR